MNDDGQQVKLATLFYEMMFSPRLVHVRSSNNSVLYCSSSQLLSFCRHSLFYSANRSIHCLYSLAFIIIITLLLLLHHHPAAASLHSAAVFNTLKMWFLYHINCLPVWSFLCCRSPRIGNGKARKVIERHTELVIRLDIMSDIYRVHVI